MQNLEPLLIFITVAEMGSFTRAADSLGQGVRISGVCGAFRRTALARVGGLNRGDGADLDMTLRLRLAGWRIVFALDAQVYRPGLACILRPHASRLDDGTGDDAEVAYTLERIIAGHKDEIK